MWKRLIDWFNRMRKELDVANRVEIAQELAIEIEKMTRMCNMQLRPCGLAGYIDIIDLNTGDPLTCWVPGGRKEKEE